MKKRVCLAVFVMGFSGLVAEILLMRELLIVFSGNELSIGLMLANWLVLEALGCLLAGRMVETSRSTLEAFAVMPALFSAALLVAVFLTRILKRAMGVSIGESIGLLPMLYGSFLILLPVSLLHGALFTLSCQVYARFSDEDVASAGKVYVYETLGTIVGGIVCTYLLVPHVNAFEASLGLATLNAIVGAVLLAPYWRRGLVQSTILVALTGLTVVSGYATLAGQADELQQRSIRAQWRNQNVVHYQNSQYGNICVVENEGQYIYFLDGLPALITPIPDIPFVEEFVHLPLLAHPEPTQILILSGGAGGVINEVLKHPTVETIAYAELDPLLLSLMREFATPLTESELNDERVDIRHVDGRLLLKATGSTYDVILTGITEPSTLQTNRFFTQQFFSLAAERLNDGGILVLGAPGSLAFMTEELRDLNSCIFHTLSSVFGHVRVIPGEGTNLFLASDAEQIATIDAAQVVERVEERSITARAMVPWHIENKLHDGWQAWFAEFIEDGTQRINTDFRPLGLFYSISHWNALHAPMFGRLYRQFERIDLRVVSVLLGLCLLFYLFLRSRGLSFLPGGVPVSVATTGFAGMIFSLTVIFAFQSIYGYVFSWIGLLVASFMAGAAGGALLMTRALARRSDGLALFMKLELALVGLAVGLPFVFRTVSAYAGSQGVFGLSRLLLLVISATGGLLVGSQFPLANSLYLTESASLGRTAGLLYASDLLGGWLGGIVGAVVLLPVLGLTGTLVTVGLLKLASFVVIATERRAASVRR